MLKRIFRAASIILLLPLAVFITGCSGPSLSGSPTMTPTSDTRVASSSASAFMSPDPAAATPDLGSYRIGDQDVLEIAVFQVPELSQTVRVADGNITLPLIGSVRASGRTAEELRADIANRSQKYLQSPQVSVNIKEFNSHRITVEGAVLKPGVFPITSRTSLLQSIALAQGFDRVADPSNVVVFRSIQGKRHAAKFDVDAIREGKAPDPELQKGDVVVVAQSGARTALRDVLQVLPIAGMFLLL
ncbi:MAG: polysaccharide biosynthesis/export family protein [Parvibaculaceae bacterium]